MGVLRAALESRGLHCQGWVNWNPSLAGQLPQAGEARSVIVLFGPQGETGVRGPQADAALEACLQSLLDHCLRERRRIIPVVFPGGEIPHDSIMALLNPLVLHFQPVDREAAEGLAKTIRSSLGSVKGQTTTTHVNVSEPLELEPDGDRHDRPYIGGLVAAATCLIVSILLGASGNAILMALAIISGLAAYASLVDAARTASRRDRGPMWAQWLKFMGEALGNEPSRAGRLT